MTEKRTAEEILESTAGHPIDAMHQYATQELDAYKARLKKLVKERIDKHENNFYDNVNDSHAFGKLSECRYLLELIDQL